MVDQFPCQFLLPVPPGKLETAQMRARQQKWHIIDPLAQRLLWRCTHRDTVHVKQSTGTGGNALAGVGIVVERFLGISRRPRKMEGTTISIISNHTLTATSSLYGKYMEVLYLPPLEAVKIAHSSSKSRRFCKNLARLCPKCAHQQCINNPTMSLQTSQRRESLEESSVGPDPLWSFDPW